MERLWKDEAELKATFLRLDPTCREAAKEFGRLVAGNPDADQSELFSMSCARACSAMGNTDPLASLKLSDAQIKAIGAVGLAISQWWIAAEDDEVEDEELADLLDDRSKIEAAEQEYRRRASKWSK